MAIVTELDFTELYRAHYVDVLRFVQRRVSLADADDIVGETFLTAWRRRHDLPAEPRPWLFRVARNVMLNVNRGSQRQHAVSVRIASQAPAVGADVMRQVDTRVDLVTAWRTLGARDQEVLALHVWDGLGDRDAAVVLGCTRATYTMRLTRAKRRLARLVEAATPYLSITLAPTGWEQS